MAASMKIIIHGAGSIGCFIGGCLMAAQTSNKNSISLLGRARLSATLNEVGMVLSDHTGWQEHIHPRQFTASADPQSLGEADLIILCVKSTSLAEAADELKRHAQPKAPIIALQNGISPAKYLQSRLPDHKILRGVVTYNIARLDDGDKSAPHWHKGSGGDILVERAPLTELLVSLTQNHAGAWRVADDFETIAWGKLLFNLNNPINALSGLTLKQQLSQRDYRLVWAAAIGETLDLLKLKNITPAKIGVMGPRGLLFMLGLPDFLFNGIAMRLQKVDAKARSSMSDDFTAKRETEIAYLNGDVVALAESLELDAPINRKLVELVKAVEDGPLRYWSAKDLFAEVVYGSRQN
jgi:2-dehydropantoate 2-reductase